MPKETKKYRVVSYMRIDVEPEADQLFDNIEDAKAEQENLSNMQVENIYMIEEVHDVQNG